MANKVACCRLKTRAQFVAMRDDGRKVVMPAFVMQYAPANALSCSLTLPHESCIIGFTVTKKMGNAVKRNRIKRRLREAARLTFPEHALPEHSYVLIGRHHAATCSFEELLGQCRKALKKSRPKTVHQPEHTTPKPNMRSCG